MHNYRFLFVYTGIDCDLMPFTLIVGSKLLGNLSSLNKFMPVNSWGFKYRHFEVGYHKTSQMTYISLIYRCWKKIPGK